MLILKPKVHSPGTATLAVNRQTPQHESPYVLSETNTLVPQGLTNTGYQNNKGFTLDLLKIPKVISISFIINLAKL